jgi:hypothetical protein
VEQSYSIQPSAQIAALRKSVEAWLQAASTQAIAAGRRDLSDRCELELVRLGWPTPATLGAVGLEKVGKSSLIKLRALQSQYEELHALQTEANRTLAERARLEKGLSDATKGITACNQLINKLLTRPKSNAEEARE